VTYEWDDRKRTENLEKHGLDFADADLVYEADFKVTLFSAPEGRRETRLVDLAKAGGVVVALIYTMRGGTVRCISMRRAKRKERRIYDAALENR
jgi:uncharacterized DUF497 family protein